MSNYQRRYDGYSKEDLKLMLSSVYEDFWPVSRLEDPWTGKTTDWDEMTNEERAYQRKAHPHRTYKAITRYGEVRLIKFRLTQDTHGQLLAIRRWKRASIQPETPKKLREELRKQNTFSKTDDNWEELNDRA